MRIILPRMLAVCASACLAVTSLAQALSISPNAKQEVLDALKSKLEQDAYVPNVDFSQLDQYLKGEKPEIEKAKNEIEFCSAVNDALKKLGISHVVALGPSQARERQQSATVGIGIRAQYDAEKHELLVVDVLQDTPASKAGLQPGDVVLEANGKPISSPMDLRGPEGERISLKVRTYKGSTVEKRIIRTKFSTAIPPSLTYLDAQTAVLRLPTFDLTYDRKKVEDILAEIRKVPGLVIDLRGNQGGAVVNMLHLLSMLMPSETPIGTFLSRRIMDSYSKEFPDAKVDPAVVARWTSSKVKSLHMQFEPYTGHIAVLLDGFSASASEIAAVALRENRDASIVGSKSAGMALVSVISNLPQGYQLEMPVTDYYSDQGYRIEGHGIEPDIEAAEPKIRRPEIPDDGVIKAGALLHRALLRDQRSPDGAGEGAGRAA